MVRRVVLAIALACCAFGVREARADEPTLDAARQAYDRGAAAYDAADYPRAASELARADELIANDVALELAIKAAIKSDDARTAITLAGRAERRTKTGPLAAAAQSARTKMAGRTGTINVTCPGRSSCNPKLDGKDVTPAEPHVVLVGEHKVVIEGGGAPRESYDVRVDPEATIVVKALPLAAATFGPQRPNEQRPPVAPASTGRVASRDNGISPAWFWVGLGITAVLGGAAIGSALDTQSKHDQFRSNPTPELRDDGTSAQLRTNLLAGGAGFAAVATTVLAVFFVGWSSPDASSASGASPPTPPILSSLRASRSASFDEGRSPMTALRAGVPITHRDQLPSTSRYELLVKIASGGMATVYVGRLSGAAGITRLVAIKRAHAHLLEDPAFSKMLIAEAKLASRIHHPNVVAVQNVEEAEGELLLVMDYVEGASLADLTGSEDIPLPARVAVRVLLDGCAGLQAAHSLEGDDGQPLGIVHRDVSPHNILVGVDGVARLTDFGIAKSSGHTGSAAHTSTGALKGKVAYMAPEYVEAGQLDARSDVFSLGIVAWEALTRQRLFRGANEIESLKLVLATEVARPSEVAPWVGKGLDDVIMKALARSPRERFTTASEFGDALEAAARREDLIATAAQVGTLVRSSTADVLARRRTLIRERHDMSETTTANARYDDRTRAAIEGALASEVQTGNVGRSENTASLAGGSGLGEISTEISTDFEAPESGTEANAAPSAIDPPPTKTLPLGMVYPAAPPSQPELPATTASSQEGSTLGGGVSAQLVEDARAEVRVGRGRRRIATYVVIAACAVGVGLFAVPALRNTGGTPRVDDPASRPEPPAPTAAAAGAGAPTATAIAPAPLPQAQATAAASASKPAPSASASSSVALHVAAPAGPPPRFPRGHVAAPPPRPPAGPAPLATPAKTQTEPATTATGDRAPPNPYAH